MLEILTDATEVFEECPYAEHFVAEVYGGNFRVSAMNRSVEDFAEQNLKKYFSKRENYIVTFYKNGVIEWKLIKK